MKRILEFLHKHNIPGFRSRYIWKSVVATLLALFLLAGVALGAEKGNDYIQVNKQIKNANQLNKDENYSEAITKLEGTKNKWTIRKIREQINANIDLNKKLAFDKSNYDNGIAKFNEGKWQEAKDLLAKVSELYPKNKDAQDKIKESDQKIAEIKQQEEEQKKSEIARTNSTNRKTASNSSRPFAKEPEMRSLNIPVSRPGIPDLELPIAETLRFYYLFYPSSRGITKTETINIIAYIPDIAKGKITGVTWNVSGFSDVQITTDKITAKWTPPADTQPGIVLVGIRTVAGLPFAYALVSHDAKITIVSEDI